jgi:hypothetical protein
MTTLFMVVVDEWGHRSFSWKTLCARFAVPGPDTQVCVVSAGETVNVELTPVPLSALPVEFTLPCPAPVSLQTSVDLATEYHATRANMGNSLKVVVLAVTDPDLESTLFQAISREPGVTVSQVTKAKRPSVRVAPAVKANTPTFKAPAPTSRATTPAAKATAPAAVAAPAQPRTVPAKPAPAAVKPAPTAVPKTVGPPPVPPPKIDWKVAFNNLGRRSVSALLTYLAMLLTASAAYVVMGALRAGDEVIPAYVASVSYLLAAVSLPLLLLPLAVGMLGRRREKLAYFAVFIAVLCGNPQFADFVHGYLPQVPALPGSTLIGPVVLEWAGASAGWVCLCLVPIALFLASRARKYLPKPGSCSTLDAFGGRTLLDRRITRIAGWSLALIVPEWIIGWLLVQAGIGLTSAKDVFDPSARAFWPYALPLILAGTVTVGAVWAIVSLAQPWRNRLGYVVTSLLVLFTAWSVLIPWAGRLWDDAEAKTVIKLAYTYYPFDQEVGCGTTFPRRLVDHHGVTAPWQLHLARNASGQVAGCNQIEIYRGWKRLGSIDLVKGQAFAQNGDGLLLTSNKSTQTKDAVFVVKLASGKRITIKAATYDR